MRLWLVKGRVMSRCSSRTRWAWLPPVSSHSARTTVERPHPTRRRCPGVRNTDGTRRQEPAPTARWRPPHSSGALPYPNYAANRRSSSLFRLGGNAISQLTTKKPNKNNDTILWLPKGQTEKREESGPVLTRKPARGAVKSQSILEKMSRKHGVMATKSPDRERRGLRVWWARRDLNPGPKDYAYHYDFRRPFQVCGLDYTFL